LVLTAIETGLRRGELVALRPRHVDFLRRTITIEETIVEVSKKLSPTGERMVVKPYPKDDEPGTLRVSQTLLDVLAAQIARLGLPDAVDRALAAFQRTRTTLAAPSCRWGRTQSNPAEPRALARSPTCRSLLGERCLAAPHVVPGLRPGDPLIHGRTAQRRPVVNRLGAVAAGCAYGQIELMCQPTLARSVAVPLLANRLTPVLDGSGKT
jgi:integrase